MFEVDTGFAGLGVLKLALDVVELAVFDEFCPGLFEPESDVVFYADVPEFHYPVEITGTGVIAGFAACNDLFDPFADAVRVQVDPFQKRFADDDLMPDGGGLVDWQTVIGTGLVFDCTANGDIVVSVSPVCRQTTGKAVNPFGNHQEIEIIAQSYHFPGLGTPHIGIFDEKIGGKTGIYECPGRDFVLSVAFFSYGQIEIFRLCYHRTVYVSFGIAAINVAMLATGTYLVATVPQVPHDRF